MNEAVLSLTLFWPLAGLVLLLALAAPPAVLLMLDLGLVFLPGHWLVAGVRVDPGDLVIAGVAVALLVRGRWRRERLPWRLPGFVLWLALGGLLSAAYLAAPENQENLTTPVRIVYQLYRYCWKPILYYPLAALLLSEPRRAWWALDALLVGGDVCAALAVPQGYQGQRAAGPFGSPNTLGAVLVVPLLVAVAGLLCSEGRWRRLAYGASLVLLVRALLFCGSRGASLACCLGCVVLIWQASHHLMTRRRLARAAPWALAGALGAFVLHPDLLDSPNLQRFLTLSHPMDEGTLQWRMKLRWPHFWRQVEAHPLLGVGTYVDLRLGESGNTPHNGYLATAVTSGLPSLALYLFFAFLALYRPWRRLARDRPARRRRLEGARDAAPVAAPPDAGAAPPGAGGSGPGASAASDAAHASGAAGVSDVSGAAGAAGVAGASGASSPSGGAGARGAFGVAGLPDRHGWVLDALVVASLAGLMVHNFDDTVWPIEAIGKVLWLLVALGLAPPRPAAAPPVQARTPAGERQRSAAPGPVPAAA